MSMQQIRCRIDKQHSITQPEKWNLTIITQPQKWNLAICDNIGGCRGSHAMVKGNKWAVAGMRMDEICEGRGVRGKLL